MRWWWGSLWLMCRGLFLAVWGLRWHGTRNVPAGGVILAANHQSFLDPPLVGACLRRETCFMARRTLFEIPLFGRLIVALNAFPIERNTGDVKGVKTAIERLKEGRALIVFPEGTRTRDGQVGQMKSGIRLLAERAAVPIVPVLIDGAYDVWPKGRLLPRPWGRITVRFGKPFRPDGTEEEFRARLRNEVLALAPRRGRSA